MGRQRPAFSEPHLLTHSEKHSSCRHQERDAYVLIQGRRRPLHLPPHPNPTKPPQHLCLKKRDKQEQKDVHVKHFSEVFDSRSIFETSCSINLSHMCLYAPHGPNYLVVLLYLVLFINTGKLSEFLRNGLQMNNFIFMITRQLITWHLRLCIRVIFLKKKMHINRYIAISRAA